MKTIYQQLKEAYAKTHRLNEEVLKGFVIHANEFFEKADIEKSLGDVLTIKSGPKPSQKQKWDTSTNSAVDIGGSDDFQKDYTVDLNVDALLGMLEQNDGNYYRAPYIGVQIHTDGKDKTRFIGSRSMIMHMKPEDKKVTFDASQLSGDALSKLAAYNKSLEQLIDGKPHSVEIQIADRRDGFELPEEYQLPTALQSTIGKFPTTVDPENEAAYDAAIEDYLEKIQTAIVDAANEIVPGVKPNTLEDGVVVLELPDKPNSAMKSKLKAAFQGAKKVKFSRV